MIIELLRSHVLYCSNSLSQPLLQAPKRPGTFRLQITAQLGSYTFTALFVADFNCWMLACRLLETKHQITECRIFFIFRSVQEYLSRIENFSGRDRKIKASSIPNCKGNSSLNEIANNQLHPQLRHALLLIDVRCLFHNLGQRPIPLPELLHCG